MKRFLVILSLSSALLISCFTHADNLLIGRVILSKQLDNGYSIIAAGGDVFESYKGQLGYFGITSKIDDHSRWHLGYFAYYPKIDGESRRDDRLRAALVYRSEFDGWHFSHRSRLEYRMGQIAKGFRYRPAFELSRPLSLEEIIEDTPYSELQLFYDLGTVTPYSEFEFFYDLRTDTITTLFFTVGIKFPIHPRVSVNIGHFNILKRSNGNHIKGPVVGLLIRL